MAAPARRPPYTTDNNRGYITGVPSVSSRRRGAVGWTRTVQKPACLARCTRAPRRELPSASAAARRTEHVCVAASAHSGAARWPRSAAGAPPATAAATSNSEDGSADDDGRRAATASAATASAQAAPCRAKSDECTRDKSRDGERCAAATAAGNSAAAAAASEHKCRSAAELRRKPRRTSW